MSTKRSGQIPTGILVLGGAAAAAVAFLTVHFSGAQAGYDSSWHLVWANQVLEGTKPTFDAWAAPTEHPLLLGIGLVAALFGPAAENAAFLTLTLCALLALLPALKRLSLNIFETWLPGALAWVLMAGAYGLLLQALRGYLDVWFLLLVTVAAILAVERKQAAAAWLPLALAGLLRPEAWLLAGLLLVFSWRSAPRTARIQLLAATVLPALVWFGIDAAVTGNPFLSFTTARNLAVEGGGGAVHAAGSALLGGIRGPATLLGLIGAGLVWRQREKRDLLVPAGLVAVGIGMALLITIAGLTLLPRYLLLCDLGLALFAGYALGGWAAFPAKDSTIWRTAGVAAMVLGAAGAIVLGAPTKLANEVRLDSSVHRDLSALLKQPDVILSIEHCRQGVLPIQETVTFPSFRLIPDALLILHENHATRDTAVRGRAQLPGTDSSLAVTIIPTDTDKRILDRYSHPGIKLPIDERVPKGFTQTGASGPFMAWNSCRRAQALHQTP